jgi:hypothetical protein
MQDRVAGARRVLAQDDYEGAQPSVDILMRRTDPIRAKEGRVTQALRGLPPTQRNHDQGRIPASVRSRWISIKEVDGWQTAFKTRYDLFEYTVMPFELINAPATFRRMIKAVMREFLDVFVIV